MTASLSAPLVAVRRAVGAAALTAWVAASLQGGASADDVGDAASRLGLRRVRTPQQDDASLLLALAELRTAGWRWPRLVLPVPGDPSGLPGPAALNVRAMSAGTALVLTGEDRGTEQGIVLVPASDELWTATEVPLPPAVVTSWPTFRQARIAFTSAVAGHGEALMELDVAADTRGLRDLVQDEDDQPLPDLPPGFPDDRRELFARARLVAILAATAQADDGASVSAAEASSRAAHLRSLAGVARRAISASVSRP